MPVIDAVLFDLGRVVIEIDFSTSLYRYLGESLEDDADTLVAELDKNAIFTRFNTGGISPEEFHAHLARLMGKSISFSEFKRLWCNILSMRPAMEALFREVCAVIPTGILSNIDPVHWEHLRSEYPALTLVKAPTLSYKVGVCKPDPAIYEAAARDVGVPVERCFFVDDKAENVTAAQAVGMRAAVYKSPQALRQILIELGVPIAAHV